MLEVARLNSFYGRAHVLHDVGCTVADGAAVVVLGRNGAGKSTLLKSLIGLVRPASGRVLFAGHDVAQMASFRRARLGLGYVPEERRVFAALTVLENLDVGWQRPRSLLQPWTPARLFALFPTLGTLRHRPAGLMSGGEQQMLAIARTLMGNPRLLLLDEPSEGLAPLVVEQLAQALAALRAEGLSLVLAEPSLRFAARVASEAVVLESGRVVWTGAVAALQADAAAHGRYLAV